MSDTRKWPVVNEEERSISVDIQKFCAIQPVSALSPIDGFYANLSALVKIGTADSLAQNDALGRVLILGLVSATENYFRNLLSGIIFVCPLSRGHANVQMLSFGSVEYYPIEDLGLALLENHSLSSKDEVVTQTKRLLGLTISDDSSLETALGAFGQLCLLRHAAVHSHGKLNHKNVRDLGLFPGKGGLALKIGFNAFQEAADVCLNVVRAYNRVIHKRLMQRWISQRLLSGEWKSDRDQIGRVFGLFQSRQDKRGASNSYAQYRHLLPFVKKALIAIDAKSVTSKST